MKFGKVDHPELVDFSLPEDNPNNKLVWGGKPQPNFNVFVGCAKWNKTELKNFYPRGTKDELAYYSTKFNAIELNATFYRIFLNQRLKVGKTKHPTPSSFSQRSFKTSVTITD